MKLNPQEIKEKLNQAAKGLLNNVSGMVPRFSFDWGILASSLEGYLDARFAILRLEFKEMMAKVVERLIFGIGLLIAGSMALIFLSVGLAFWLNDLLGNQYGGWLIMGTIFLIATGSIAYLAKNRLFDQVSPITDVTANEVTKPEPEVSTSTEVPEPAQ